MRLAYKILIALTIAFVALFGVPAGVALAKGKSEAPERAHPDVEVHLEGPQGNHRSDG